SALGGWSMTVNPNTKNKDAVMEVIETAMTDDFQLGMLDISGWLPSKPGLFNSKKATNQKPIGRYMESLRIAGKNTMPRPVAVAWTQESTQIYQKVNGIAKGGSSPKKGLSNLKSSLESIENDVGSARAEGNADEYRTARFRRPAVGGTRRDRGPSGTPQRNSVR